MAACCLLLLLLIAGLPLNDKLWYCPPQPLSASCYAYLDTTGGCTHCGQALVAGMAGLQRKAPDCRMGSPGPELLPRLLQARTLSRRPSARAWAATLSRTTALQSRCSMLSSIGQTIGRGMLWHEPAKHCLTGAAAVHAHYEQLLEAANQAARNAHARRMRSRATSRTPWRP
jgi:hypothetical protein